MSSCFSVTKQRQIPAMRIVLCCGSVGLSFLAIVGFGLFQRVQAAENIPPARQIAAAPNETHSKLDASYGKLPLSFEANQGQVGGPVQSLWGGRGYTLFLTGHEAVLALRKAAARSWKPEVEGSERRSGGRIPRQRERWRGEKAT